MKIAIYEGEEQVEYIELSGDVSDYDIIINSSTPTSFPKRKTESEPPEIPSVDPDTIEKKSNRNTYTRMRDNPDSLPAQIRRCIYQRRLMTRVQLDAWLTSNDYSTRSGGVRESLIVLENETEELKRIGEGDDQQLVWTGKE